MKRLVPGLGRDIPQSRFDTRLRVISNPQGIERLIPVLRTFKLLAHHRGQHRIAQFFPAFVRRIRGIETAGHCRGFAVADKTIGMNLNNNGIFFGNAAGTDLERFR